MAHPTTPTAQGLYNPSNEHDACGVGFIAHIKGEKSHAIVQHGLQILDNLTHRGATGYDPLLGDGAGILIQLPDAFLRRECAQLGISLPDPGSYVFAVGLGAQHPVVRNGLTREVTASEWCSYRGMRRRAPALKN